ncbi:sensor histidine kinase [Chitinophaga skermanii]|nr:HAMP domain-containing sensor histidine kinase [Chitinophaga skermanii]
MRTAVFNKQFADVRRIVRYGNNDTTQNDLPKEVRQLLNADKRNEGKPYRELKIYLNDSTRQTAKLDSSAHVYVDTLAKQISEILIINNIYGNRFSLKRLDSVFTTELVNRGITSAHRLDTFHIDFNNFARESFRDSLHIREAFKTSKTPFNPISNLFVQASFETPVPYILKQMMWTLISSVLVLILTSISMIYMMRTILKQKKLSEVKNDFINNMTHELKTPIATVYAAVEAMQNFNALNDQQKTENYLNISKQQLQRLSDLVEKVLHIAAEEKETIDLYPEDVDMLEIITSIVNNHELKANKPVNFHIEVPEDAFIMADKTHLSNAINNLVDNAIKYSKEQADITIRIYKQENNWKIVVKDKGIGIPKSYQDTIFEKFFRVPTGDLHNVKGFGLGLSYVKKIVDMHTGTITVHSEPNSGSEFIITIPA